MKLSEKELNRFVVKIKHSDNPEDCWLWLGTTDKFGYGRFLLDYINRTAHTVSFEHFVEPLAGRLCLHKCNNPSCVNPKHLKAGTYKENLEDSYAAGTARPFGRSVRRRWHTDGRQSRRLYPSEQQNQNQVAVLNQKRES